MGLLNKSKSFNRRGRKGKTQSSQRAEFMCLSFVFFATSLRSLRLKRIFSTIPISGMILKEEIPGR